MRGWKMWSVLALLLSGCALEEGAPTEETETPAPEATQQSRFQTTATGAQPQAENPAQVAPAAQTGASPVNNPGEFVASGNGGKPQPDPWRAAGINPDKPQPDPWRGAAGPDKPQPDPWHQLVGPQTHQSKLASTPGPLARRRARAPGA